MSVDPYILSKIQKYCVYQERCHKEVRSKLLGMKVYGDKLEEVMAALISDDFLNEERFAIAFTREKYRLTKWGRNKILNALKAKSISEYCIKKAFGEIDETEYLQILEAAVKKKYELLKDKEPSPFKLKSKIYTYIAGRGYESYLIKDQLEKLMD